MTLQEKKVKAMDMYIALLPKEAAIRELQEELRPEAAAYKKLLDEIIEESKPEPPIEE